jgi:tetratricopeptide (TPR) repeat protein
MSSPRQRGRARRRVAKTMDEAFEALARGEHALAEKLSRRAADEGHVNPRIWFDRARIALACGDRREGESALRRAIALAPGFGEAWIELGSFLAAAGRVAGARRAWQRALAVVHDAATRDEIAARVAALPASDADADADADDDAPPEAELRAVAYSARALRLSEALADETLLARGVTCLSAALQPAEIEGLTALLAPGSLAVDRELVWSDPDRDCAWRTARRPLAPALAELVRDASAALAPSLASWAGRFPARGRDAQSGSPAAEDEPVFVTLPANGVLGPWRPPGARTAQPFCAFVVIALDEDTRLLHELVDLRPGRRRRSVRTSLRCGDALFACAQRRPVQVGGVEGLQELAHEFRVSGAGAARLLWLPLAGPV